MNAVTIQNLTDAELIHYARMKCCADCATVMLMELANRLEQRPSFKNEEHVHVRQ